MRSKSFVVQCYLYRVSIPNSVDQNTVSEIQPSLGTPTLMLIKFVMVMLLESPAVSFPASYILSRSVHLQLEKSKVGLALGFGAEYAVCDHPPEYVGVGSEASFKCSPG